jgi:hypothetical protein
MSYVMAPLKVESFLPNNPRKQARRTKTIEQQPNRAQRGLHRSVPWRITINIHRLGQKEPIMNARARKHRKDGVIHRNIDETRNDDYSSDAKGSKRLGQARKPQSIQRRVDARSIRLVARASDRMFRSKDSLVARSISIIDPCGQCRLIVD